MIINTLKTFIKPERILNHPDDLNHYGKDWTTAHTANPCLVVLPKTIDEIIKLVQFANQETIALVPSGGRTGLSGGAMACQQEIVVSFEKMNQLIELNPIDQTVVVQAGMVTQQLQHIAQEHNLYYPVDFASSGSSQIGGNIATNAGGIKVIRHGLTRDQVLGLTVVTGKGDVLNLNNGLIKNATGYDLRHLFIGSEGTLGLIVEATLKLTQPPKPWSVLLLSTNSFEHIMQIFNHLQTHLTLNAFEFFSEKALQHVLKKISKPHPFDQPNTYYTLIEFEHCDENTQEQVMALFEHFLEKGWISDGIISQNETQAQQIWQYRELISETISVYTPYKNDISVKPSRIAEFLNDVESMVHHHYPNFEIIWFGHIGDGNVHLNILKPNTITKDDFLTHCGKVNQEVMKIVQKYNGSVSAEHGIGLLKKEFLKYSKSESEINYMKSIKQIFDPNNIMNPGKII